MCRFRSLSPSPALTLFPSLALSLAFAFHCNKPLCGNEILCWLDANLSGYAFLYLLARCRWQEKAAYFEYRKLPLPIQKNFRDPPDFWKAEIMRQKGDSAKFKRRGRNPDFAVNPTYLFTLPCPLLVRCYLIWVAISFPNWSGRLSHHAPASARTLQSKTGQAKRGEVGSCKTSSRGSGAGDRVATAYSIYF